MYRIFWGCKNENFRLKNFGILIFAQNIDYGYTLKHVGAKIRKIGIPLHTPVLLFKSGVEGGVHYMDMFS